MTTLREHAAGFRKWINAWHKEWEGLANMVDRLVEAIEGNECLVAHERTERTKCVDSLSNMFDDLSAQAARDRERLSVMERMHQHSGHATEPGWPSVQRLIETANDMIEAFDNWFEARSSDAYRTSLEAVIVAENKLSNAMSAVESAWRVDEARDEAGEFPARSEPNSKG
jgi:hypothetical protein